MATLFLKRTLYGVELVQGDIPQAWKLGQILRADVKLSRNIGLHRKAFALLDVLHPHTEYQSKETLRDALTVGAGYVDTVINPMTGEAGWKPKSWAFANMDGAEFESLHNAMIDVALKLVAGSTRADWEEAERQIIGF